MTLEEKARESSTNAFLNTNKIISKSDYEQGYLACAKENADLKEECEAYAGLYLKSDEQLTKAKEHIRTLISCLIDWVQEGDKDYCYIADAEQFLKDVPET